MVTKKLLRMNPNSSMEYVDIKLGEKVDGRYLDGISLDGCLDEGLKLGMFYYSDMNDKDHEINKFASFLIMYLKRYKDLCPLTPVYGPIFIFDDEEDMTPVKMQIIFNKMNSML